MRSTADSSNRAEWATALAVAAVLLLVLWLAAKLLMPALGPSDQSSLMARFGATVERIDPATAQKLGDGAEADELVVTSVAEGGPADRAGVRAGDVIESVAGRRARSDSELASALGDAPVALIVNRGGGHVMLTLPASGPPGGADQGRR